MPVIQSACPHDCPDNCAIRITVKGGRAIGVEGDPTHPITAGFVCGKVRTYVDRVYAPDRILRPMVRTGAKGSGAFRETSWDEALEVAAAGIADAVARHGGETVLPYSFLGNQGAIQGNVMSGRLMHALGATTLERTVCDAAAMMGVAWTHGEDVEVDPEEWHHARTVVLWGWNPIATAPHLWAQIVRARQQGARLVVVDPYRSRTARVADEHLAPVPGTDGALALGLMRSLVDQGRVAERWCRAHTVGYDDLIARLDEYPVERCAAITGIAADTIATLATALAEGQPTLVRLGVGAQRHAGAEMAYRTIACLPALAGSWQHRGGGFSYSPLATFAALPLVGAERPDLLERPVRSVAMGQLGRALTGLTDPPVTALVVYNANPVVGEPNESAVLQGLQRDDLFCLVVEQFLTDTARYADVILPATTALEHRDVVPSWGHHYLTLGEPAIEPVGEARSNTEIFRLLASRLGLDHPALRASDDELIDELLDGSAIPLDRNELRDRGWTKIDLGQGHTPHRDGAFPTPSGKLQLRSDALAALGEDPLPYYDPPGEIADEARADRFPLAMITPKTQLYLNSTFANGPRQMAAQPTPWIVLHPEDAARHGVVDGTRARVFNDRGAFEAVARVSDDTRPGVLIAPMGWWRTAWGGPSCQVTISDAVTRHAHGPLYNDSRVNVAPA